MSGLIAPLVEAVQSGKTTARQLVEEALTRAKADTHHAILSLNDEAALAQADELDARRAKGETIGRLAGVPFLAKDNLLVRGTHTTAASHILENFVAPFDATVIEALEAEGAICIGKTNLDAFAHGGSTENSYFGPTTNPHDETRVPGGSSGGSAAAVALDIVPFALGTDTGGSIRQPASFCGVVGYKPTYGAVSRYGAVAMASSTDVIGPMTRSAEDAALVFEIMAGRDARDSTTLPDFYAPKQPGDTLTIGVIDEFMGDGVDDSVKAAVQQTIDRLEAAGHTIRRVSLPSVKYALAVYYIVVPAEVSSNLARYDGIKYGVRAEAAQNLSDVYEKSRSEGFMDENKRRILIGNYVLSSGYYDAYYHKAQTVRTRIINEFNTVFEDCDLLVGPVAPTPAFKLGANTHDPLSMYLADIMTVPPSLAGLPAISVPAGMTDDGLPVGLQIIGRMKADADVLALARQVEEL